MAAAFRDDETIVAVSLRHSCAHLGDKLSSR